MIIDIYYFYCCFTLVAQVLHLQTLLDHHSRRFLFQQHLTPTLFLGYWKVMDHLPFRLNFDHHILLTFTLHNFHFMHLLHLNFDNHFHFNFHLVHPIHLLALHFRYFLLFREIHVKFSQSPFDSHQPLQCFLENLENHHL